VLLGAVAFAVAVAFADSSIVVLALPELYGRFDTSIEGVSWVITAYNLALAVGALTLVLVVHRIRARVLLAAGALVFVAASIACALASSLGPLVAARAVQGVGGALLLAGALPVLGAVAGSTARGVAVWTVAGTFGAALGPALGGVLTQAFDWRAIFVAQAPIVGASLLTTVGSPVAASLQATAGEDGRPPGLGGTLPANAGLALIFGALVGALFLGVLLVIDVFGLEPLQGALVVTAIPAAALLVRPVAAALPPVFGVGSGAVLLAAGLAGLALLPSSDLGYVVAAFVLCGAGLGLSVPALTHAAVGGEDGGAIRSATLTVGLRHLGLVLAIAIVAPILAGDLAAAVDVAELNATAVIVDGEIPATTKIPLALDIRDALDRAPRGELPDLSGPFEEHGAASDPAIRLVQDDLTRSIREVAIRASRPSFLVAALLAALALVPLAGLRRRVTA
jgi:predicted MFS family arabinose efflux permease